MIRHTCLDCGKQLSSNPKAIRCISCHLKNRWKNNKIRAKNIRNIIKNWSLRKKPKVRCNGCDKELFDRRSIYCDDCMRQIRFLNKNHYYCIDCKKEITSGSKLGRCKSCATKGENNPMSGIVSPNKGKKLTKIHKLKIGLGNKNKIVSKESRRKMSLVKGGTGIPYEFAEYNRINFNNSLKESILQRDTYICQNCSMTEEVHLIVIGNNLNIHHIDYDKENCKEDNLITLCHWCNLRANKNRTYWQEYYTNKIKEIINVKNM